MEEQITTQRRPRRRKKTRMEIIKEAYLPYAFLLIAAIFIVVCIVGAIARAGKEEVPETEESGVPQIAAFVEDETI